jgi:hypothetical protein
MATGTMAGGTMVGGTGAGAEVRLARAPACL